jgi:WD40 repeat protein
VAVGDDRGRVFVWNIQARTLLATMDCGQRGRVARVALSEDGKRVAAPTLNGILLGVVEEPATRITVAGDNQAVFRFLPGGDRFISGDRSGSVRVWLTDGSEESTFYGHVGRVTGLGVSPDGRIVVSGDASGEVKFWDVRSGQELITLRRHLGPVTTIEFAQNGKLLVTGGDGQVAFWEAGE